MGIQMIVKNKMIIILTAQTNKRNIRPRAKKEQVSIKNQYTFSCLASFQLLQEQSILYILFSSRQDLKKLSKQICHQVKPHILEILLKSTKKINISCQTPKKFLAKPWTLLLLSNIFHLLQNKMNHCILVTSATSGQLN